MKLIIFVNFIVISTAWGSADISANFDPCNERLDPIQKANYWNNEFNQSQKALILEPGSLLDTLQNGDVLIQEGNKRDWDILTEGKPHALMVRKDEEGFISLIESPRQEELHTFLLDTSKFKEHQLIKHKFPEKVVEHLYKVIAEKKELLQIRNKDSENRTKQRSRLGRKLSATQRQEVSELVTRLNGHQAQMWRNPPTSPEAIELREKMEESAMHLFELLKKT